MTIETKYNIGDEVWFTSGSKEKCGYIEYLMTHYECSRWEEDKVMKFNSQICTTKEQSERLLALGLKKETADMCLHIGLQYPVVTPYNEVDEFYHKVVIPAWSLHRLIEMMPNEIRVYDSIASLIVFNEKVQYYLHDVEYSDYLTGVARCKSGNIYDNIIDCIEELIKEGYFNKEYLEE